MVGKLDAFKRGLDSFNSGFGISFTRVGDVSARDSNIAKLILSIPIYGCIASTANQKF
jgi:hypothetical protein